ncbi:MAG: sterol desaturase family protein [Myxococcota bacterium]
MLEPLADLLDWKAAGLVFAFLSLRYVLIAGGAAFVFYAGRKPRRLETKIQARWPRASDYRREIGYSFLTFVFFILTGQAVLRGPLAEFHHLYLDPSQYGWTWLVVSLPVVLVLHDAWFYWMHRLIHHPRLYRRAHLVHHKSINPTPWASFAFHPFEAILEAGGILFQIFLLPLHPGVLGLAMVIMTVYNVYGHLGWELYPKGFASHPVGRFVNTSVSHNQHHARARNNYGLYFLWWDRWMGTLDEGYEAAFEAVAERRAERDAEELVMPA